MQVQALAGQAWVGTEPLLRVGCETSEQLVKCLHGGQALGKGLSQAGESWGTLA